MTNQGGSGGNGTIFRIPVTGGVPTVLYSFDYNIHGAYPCDSLTLSGSTFYGMTSVGGANDGGILRSRCAVARVG
jgi:uncharacterized repeat protein (TIGR03803 family)